MTARRVSPISITSALPAEPTLTVQGALGQSANLAEWKDSTGAVVKAVSITGVLAAGKTTGAPTIASATTIAPTTPILFVSGTTAIATITAPAPISTNGGQIALIPTGIFTTTTAGNIALASTSVVSRVLFMTYDPVTVKWYPSY